MAESEGIKEIVNKVTIQAATVVMMPLRDMEARPYTTIAASQREPQKQGHSRTIHMTPAFKWDTWDRYVELMNFKMEANN